MHRKNKNQLGLLWFVPAVYTTVRWVLGMIGDVQTAYSVMQTPWITVDWVVVSHLLALVGVWWIGCVNYDLFEGWYKRKYRKRNFTLTGTDLIEYIVNYSVAGSSFRGSNKFTDAAQAVVNEIKLGNLKFAIRQGATIQEADIESIQNAAFTMVPKKGQYSLSEEGVRRFILSGTNDQIIAEEIYLDKQDVNSRWPAVYAGNSLLAR